MDAIYDRSGRTVGWLYDNVVVDPAGVCRAYVDAHLRDGSLYSYAGAYLGRLSHGLFRDRAGDVTAFVEGASGGPPRPFPALPPDPPRPPVPPIPKHPPVPPPAPAESQQWSRVGWEAFLTG